MAQKSARLVTGKEVVEVPVPEPVVVGTTEIENLIASGYPDIGTVENAKKIIAERDGNPALYPFETYQRAKAFIAACTTPATVISKRSGWRRRE